MKQSDAYVTSTQFLVANEKVKEQVGELEGFGMFPSGQIQIKNGYGKAILNISVHGSKGDASSTIFLTKEPDATWVVKDFKIE